MTTSIEFETPYETNYIWNWLCFFFLYPFMKYGHFGYYNTTFNALFFLVYVKL